MEEENERKEYFQGDHKITYYENDANKSMNVS